MAEDVTTVKSTIRGSRKRKSTKPKPVLGKKKSPSLRDGKPVYRRDEVGFDALRRLVQLEFPREVERRWIDCLVFCRGHFEVVIYKTNMLRSREVLPGFANPERAPATAIGFRANYATISYVMPTGHPEPPRVEQTPPQMHYLEWVTIVEPREIERALVHVLKKAQYMLMQAKIHASTKGAITA